MFSTAAFPLISVFVSKEFSLGFPGILLDREVFAECPQLAPLLLLVSGWWLLGSIWSGDTIFFTLLLQIKPEFDSVSNKKSLQDPTTETEFQAPS